MRTTGNFIPRDFLHYDDHIPIAFIGRQAIVPVEHILDGFGEVIHIGLADVV